MPSNRHAAALRKRSVRDGAALVAAQTAQLLGFPIARDVARHLHSLFLALKPTVFQAPNENEDDAQALIKSTVDTIQVLDDAVGEFEGLWKGSDEMAVCLEELQQFYDHLKVTLDELQDIQRCRKTLKFVSQVHIHDLIAQKKELLTAITWKLLTRLAIFGFMNASHNTYLLEDVRHRIEFLEQRENTVLMSNQRGDAAVVLGTTVVLFA